MTTMMPVDYNKTSTLHARCESSLLGMLGVGDRTGLVLSMQKVTVEGNSFPLG